MTRHQMHPKEFLVGAAVGSLLGGVAALLMAPKTGDNLRKDISDVYCNLSDKTHYAADQISKKSKLLASCFGGQACDWTDKAKSLVDNVKEKYHPAEACDDECMRDLLVGGLVGGILGAVAGLLLAPKSGEDLRHDLADTYHDMSDRTHEFANNASKQGKSFAKKANRRANKWLELAKGLVEELTDDVHDTSEEWTEKAKSLVNNDRINDMMDWASVGFRIWQGLKSRR